MITVQVLGCAEKWAPLSWVAKKAANGPLFCAWDANYAVGASVCVITSGVGVIAVVTAAVSQTGAEQRACDQAAYNTWSVIVVTVSAVSTTIAAVAVAAIAPVVAAAISTPSIPAARKTSAASAKSASGHAATKSTSAEAATMKATPAASVETTTSAMSAAAMSAPAATATSECRGRCRKCHCQAGSSYRSIFHNCLLHYG